MKKLSWMLALTLLSVILVTGCSESATPNESEAQTPVENSDTQMPNESPTSQATEEAIRAAEVYKLKEYTISEVPESPLNTDSVTKRNQELESFFAENFTEKPVNATNVVMPLRAAETHQAILKPENIKFTVYQELEDYVDLDYTMDLKIEMQSGDSESVPLEGRLSLVNKNDKWLIQADTFDTGAYEILMPQNKK